MNDSAPDRNTQIDNVVNKILEAAPRLQGIDLEILRELLEAGRNALLGETTVHTVVHGRREGEVATFNGRIGRVTGPEVDVTEDGDDGPAVQINIWVRR